MAESKKKYENATALRRALEDRLSKHSEKTRIDVPRLRKQVAFDRLLARLFHGPQIPWVLKGGYAMEIRVGNARGTRDIDLALKETKFLSKSSDEQSQAILDLLKKNASIDLGVR
ncbi:MAG: hypothetical protein RJB38_1721 [Pseudomonadota bacterium]|jgi:hypothetical protein